VPNAHQVLWTAGWDSTYRVCDLLLNRRATVQPWYVVDRWRKSTPMERRTQALIRTELMGLDPTVAARLLPVRAISIDDIPADPDITARYRTLLNRSFLGEQYDWLARLAKTENVTLELSIHADDKAHGFLQSKVVSTEGIYRLRDSLDDNALRLFEQFAFPLFDMSKLDMEHAARDSGFEHVLENTWFCFNPLYGDQPCGYCNPCRYTREEGLGRRIPDGSPLRKVHAATVQAMWLAWQKARAAVTFT
jgi:hypothetical protein